MLLVPRSVSSDFFDANIKSDSPTTTNPMRMKTIPVHCDFFKILCRNATDNNPVKIITEPVIVKYILMHFLC